MRTGISVVICSYNGAELLPETIKHLVQQKVSLGLSWEIIIIDNASTDNTAEVAISEWRKYQIAVSFSVLKQPKQGLTFARELALEQAKYKFVLFCDDDNWLSPDYVNCAYEIMDRQPNIGILGGNGTLEFETNPPLWAASLSSFANGPQAIASGKVENNIVYGAGFTIRKSAYESLVRAGYKPLLSDRSGNSLSAGGDYELCYAITLIGYDIWYEENLKFKHFMPAKRINWNYCVRLYKEGAECLTVLTPYRLRVNKNVTSTLSFNINLFKTFLNQSKKLLPLLIQKFKLQPDSEEAKLNLLKITALKARILSLRNIKGMQQNFFKILTIKHQVNRYNQRMITPSKASSKHIKSAI
ncbi:glycosyltransferase family 2 protein [Pontibacter sp. BT310]|uniref:Glycosyltransferase family 2 protein n=1 Tax=Pontibacter populi TaxID=890055 RepID=A0ABS6XAW7_9BACT|nr:MULTISPECIES: glycosyltransferase [Pontibacter]MBJ6118263.1 glycosyltransferase family 2 protein [Pontibacter sp. BT310]MBR0570690.1 glycosyltransferase family 2 protein [Microvirga sp. STS03]MBW3365116.1 glycosyltransferase family 2 protein [Pontibacter populi]